VIYLASPYNHPDPAVRHDRFVRVAKAAAKLIANGEVVYCAITHTHPIEKYGNLPVGWSYWQALDEFYLDLANKLVIVKIDGYDRSEGIKAETARALALGKPVEYMEDVVG
jgi:hypothetical protein